MKTLIKQIGITVSLIALTSIIIGVSGLFNSWSLPKSLNILISGITGLIISTSVILTVHHRGFVLRLIQISLMILLIFTATNLNTDQIFYFALTFSLLWIITLIMHSKHNSVYGYILMIALVITTLIGFLIDINSIVYISIFIILIYNTIDISISIINQSK